jgi:hypothetical protein
MGWIIIMIISMAVMAAMIRVNTMRIIDSQQGQLSQAVVMTVIYMGSHLQHQSRLT